MTASPAVLFGNVPKTDPLNLWSPEGLKFQDVATLLDYSHTDLSQLARVTKKSVRLDNRIPKELKQRLEEIANIANLVAAYFEGDAEKTALWFRLPNPMLGGVAPRDMIRHGRYKKLLNFVMSAQEENPES